jgi:hypothetical protein
MFILSHCNEKYSFVTLKCAAAHASHRTQYILYLVSWPQWQLHMNFMLQPNIPAYTINYCIVLYCIVLYCIVLYCIVLYCIVLYCIVLYCSVLYCIVLYCIVLYCIVLYCIILYCIVLYCKACKHNQYSANIR